MPRSTLDHVAFVIGSLERAIEQLDLPAQPPRSFPKEGTHESYLGEAGATARILLIQPDGESGPYAEALGKRGAGLHHVALRVDDLERFVAEVVDGSGWLVHPRTLRHSGRAVWLARPGVEVLVELFERDVERGAPMVTSVQIAGLDQRPGLAKIFAGCGVEVVAGTASGVVLERGGRLVCSPEHATADVAALGDAAAHNRLAWDRKVEDGDRWTVGVDSETIARARQGELEILLTPTKAVPASWLGALEGTDVLCLASGGGQQAPLLAAAGARVTVVDASAAQLGRDREVAEREQLALRCLRGDMRDLRELAPLRPADTGPADGDEPALEDGAFDLIVHPCSNCFVAELAPVWREAARVLRPGGHLLSGFNNPVISCYDWATVERGDPRLRYRLPYRDLDHLDSPFVVRSLAAGEPLEFSHTLADQLDGQAAAGLAIVGLYEDGWGSGAFPDAFFDAFLATRARKL